MKTNSHNHRKKKKHAQRSRKAVSKHKKVSIDRKGIKKQFWEATDNSKGLSLIEMYHITAPLGGLAINDFIAVGIIESGLRFRPGSYYGAEGTLQVFDNTFITQVAHYGNDEDIRRLFAAYSPKAGRILDNVMRRVPRDPKTGIFLFDRMTKGLRKDILALRKLGSRERAFVELAFASKDIGVRIRKMGLSPEGYLVRLHHKYSSPKAVESRLPKVKQRGSRLYAEAKKFGLIAREVKAHLLAYYMMRSRALASNAWQRVKGRGFDLT